jgi:prepilin-type N-terminal cleavage/methylation domain-containing protein
MKKRNGFTLVEVLVYLALFGLVFSGLLVGAFAVIGNIGRNDAQIMAQYEGNFILAKIERELCLNNFVIENGALKLGGNFLNNSQMVVSNLEFTDLDGLVRVSFLLEANTDFGQNYSQNFSTVCEKR